VANADQEAPPLALAHPLDLLGQGSRGLRRVRGEADRQAVAGVRAESLGLVESKCRAGRVDQEVVGHLLALAIRGLGCDVGGRVVALALRVELPRCCLHELDTRPFVDGCERERHLRRLHQPHAHPDVGRHPVVVGPGRDDRHGVAAPEPAAREGGGGVPRDARAEDNHAAHPCTILRSPTTTMLNPKASRSDSIGIRMVGTR
jgi:hypothetical protein